MFPYSIAARKGPRPANNDADISQFICRKATRPSKVFSGIARSPQLVPLPPVFTESDLRVDYVQAAPVIPVENKPKDLPRLVLSKQRYQPYSIAARKGAIRPANNDDEISQFICRKATRPSKVFAGTAPRLAPPLPPAPVVIVPPAVVIVPPKVVDPLKDLRNLSSNQLRKIEKKNPELLAITNELWEIRCRDKYGSLVQDMEEPDDPYQTWKDLYFQLKAEHRIRKEERKARKAAKKIRKEQREIRRAERKARKEREQVID